jgi:hypothetical protein
MSEYLYPPKAERETFLMRREDLRHKFGIDAVPTPGEATETVILGRRVRIEHTDLHRPTGARLFRVTWLEEVPHA